MRIIKLVILGFVSCFTFGLVSCSDEQHEVLEQTSKNTASTRYVMDTPFGYVPEWWDGKSQLDGPYEYQTSLQDHPYNTNIEDNCSYYFSFVYSWHTYALQYYNRMQLQYRCTDKYQENYHFLESLPDSEWHNIGERYSDARYSGGILSVGGLEGMVDIDAHHFPKARLNFRYRLLHVSYDENYPNEFYKNTILSTKWTVVDARECIFDNPYGFLPGEGGDYGTLCVHVGTPEGSRYVSYIGTALLYGAGKSNSTSVKSGNIMIIKPSKEGRWEVTMEESYSPSITPGMGTKQSIGGTYDPSVTDVYANFTVDDFKY